MAITWAIAAILQSRFLRSVAPIPTVALGTWASVVLLAPLALPQLSQDLHWTVASVLAFGYLVVFGTCFGMVISLWLYRKLRPTTITLTTSSRLSWDGSITTSRDKQRYGLLMIAAGSAARTFLPSEQL